MWWLSYLREDRVRVIIYPGNSLRHARLSVSIAGLDEEAEFIEGHKLGEGRAKLVPKSYLSRPLPVGAAERVLRTMESKPSNAQSPR
jgi:hypothetical protein